MLGDASGRIAALDISNTRVQVREPKQDRIFHTNRYCHPGMADIELEATSVHHHRSPEQLRGRRVHQSADERDTCFQRLLQQRESFGLDDVQAVMSDHGENDAPSADTICMHSDYWFTTASLQFLPQQRMMRVAFSSACDAGFTELGLG